MHSTIHLTCLAAAIASVVSPLSSQQFTPHRLNADGIAALGSAKAISEQNIIAGLGSSPTGDGIATSWTLAGVTTVLPALPNDELAEAYGISPAGLVVGSSFDVVQVGHQFHATKRAVVWVDGFVLELSSLFVGGATNLDPQDAIDANRYGTILGWGRDAAQFSGRGFVVESGIVTDIGSVLGAGVGNSTPADINDRGVVVGKSTAITGRPHAFVWKDGVMTDLHDPSWGFSSEANAIDESGVIVGAADLTDDGLQWETAVMWVDGVPLSLGTLGGQTSAARGINEHGTVVGVSSMPVGSPSSPHAFVWRDGTLIDLNDLIDPNSGWILQSANDINDQGIIVGAGVFGGASLQPFALVPNCDGTFEVYGTACAGSAGFEPRLAVSGCVAADENVSIVATNGLGGAVGALLFGSGNGTVPFLGCEFQVLPTIPLSLSFVFDGDPGVGGSGTWRWVGQWPTGFPPLYAQVLSIDGGAASGLTASNAISITP